MAYPDVSVIIVSYNTKELLLKCIESVRRFTKKVLCELIVVDNGSIDGSVGKIKNQILKIKNTKSTKSDPSGIKKLKLIENKRNLGFGGANNQGMKIAQGKYIALLNSDTELFEDSLSKMVSFMDARKGAGVAACKLLNKDRSVQANGGYLPDLFRLFLWAGFIDDVPFLRSIFGSYHNNQETSREHEQGWVSGAFMILRRELLEKVDGFDKDFFMYSEDTEFCLRAREAGWKVFFTPVTSIIHFGSGSSGGDMVHFKGGSWGKEKSILGEFEGLKKIYKKHYSFWQYPFLILILKLAALLRFLVFGIVLRRDAARRIYAKAFIR